MTATETGAPGWADVSLAEGDQPTVTYRSSLVVYEEKQLVVRDKSARKPAAPLDWNI